MGLVLLTAAYPPQKCGVADYAFSLKNSEEAGGWALLHVEKWNVKSFFKIIKKIKKHSMEQINLQYPSIYFGDSIIPHLLCIYFYFFTSKHFSVTIHEYSSYGWKGRAAMSLFFIFASKLIFTTSFEMEKAVKAFPKAANKSRVIKICSNIKPAEVIPKIENRKFDIGYFGFIASQKGLEAFLTTITDLKKQLPNLKVFIMGNIQNRFEKYAKEILDTAQIFNIEVFTNKANDEVSNILANTKIAFLPFPDGVSERRGSFLASAENQCLIITTEGEHTTDALKNCCETIAISKAKEAIINTLKNSNLFAEKQQKIKQYLLNEIPNSWNEVAKEYNHFLK